MDSLAFDYEAALERCKQGDQLALKSLYDQEARWLLGVAFRIVRQRQLAEDVVQEAFIQIWNRAESFDATLGSARGWIYSVVRNRALSEIRRPGMVRRVEVENIDALMWRRDQPDEERQLLNTEQLQHCLDQLDKERRDCIEAAFLEGFTQAELAKRFDLPLGTVKSWIRRGLLALRACLE